MKKNVTGKVWEQVAKAKKINRTWVLVNISDLAPVLDTVDNLSTEVDARASNIASLEFDKAQLVKQVESLAEIKAAFIRLFGSCDTGERRKDGSISGAAVPDWDVLEDMRKLVESPLFEGEKP